MYWNWPAWQFIIIFIKYWGFNYLCPPPKTLGLGPSTPCHPPKSPPLGIDDWHWLNSVKLGSTFLAERYYVLVRYCHHNSFCLSPVCLWRWWTLLTNLVIGNIFKPNCTLDFYTLLCQKWQWSIAGFLSYASPNWLTLQLYTFCACTLRCRPTVVLPVKSTAIVCQWSAIGAFCTASLLKLTYSNVLLSDLVISSCYCCNPIVMLCVCVTWYIWSIMYMWNMYMWHMYWCFYTGWFCIEAGFASTAGKTRLARASRPVKAQAAPLHSICRHQDQESEPQYKEEWRVTETQPSSSCRHQGVAGAQSLNWECWCSAIRAVEWWGDWWVSAVFWQQSSARSSHSPSWGQNTDRSVGLWLLNSDIILAVLGRHVAMDLARENREMLPKISYFNLTENHC